MKTFLNVIGALALLAVIPVFSMAQSAIHEIEACIALLIGCICIGVGVLSERIDEGHKIMRDQGKVLIQILNELERAPNSAPSQIATPVLPGKERYFVSDGENALGPHELQAIRALFERGTLTNETLVLQEGTKKWVKLGNVLAG